MPERQEIDPSTEKKEEIKYFPKTKDAVKEYRKVKAEVIHSTRKIDLAENQPILKEIFEKIGYKLAKDEKIDVLNPTNEFEFNGETYMAGRAEPTKSKFDPRTIFFKKIGEHWEPQPDLIFKMEDPSITKIGDEFVLCGTEIKVGLMSHLERLFSGDKVGIKVTSWRTVFYKGKTLEDLARFAEGPDGMKDVRLVQLADGKIGVYTRPQGWLKKGDAGQIGFTIIDNLSDLNAKVIEDAPLLSTRFPEGEWGGVNQAILLPDGRVLAIGHRAYYEGYGKKKIRHYYPWAFIHDPKTGEIIDLGILAERKDFPKGHAKRDDLIDILFTAGIKFLPNNLIDLIVGMSDVETGGMERDVPEPLKGMHL